MFWERNGVFWALSVLSFNKYLFKCEKKQAKPKSLSREIPKERFLSKHPIDSCPTRPLMPYKNVGMSGSNGHEWGMSWILLVGHKKSLTSLSFITLKVKHLRVSDSGSLLG